MFSCVCTAEGSTCLLLCLVEPVTGIVSALLASLMDMVVLKWNCSELLTPLSQPDSLKLLQSSQETLLLQLLTPKTDAQTSTADAAVSAVKVQTKYCIYVSILHVCFFFFFLFASTSLKFTFNVSSFVTIVVFG